MPMSLADQKKATRLAALQIRKNIDLAAPEYTANRLADNVSKLLADIDGVTLVSGFLSISDEINTRPTLHKLSTEAFELCLPVVLEPQASLTFRVWKEGDELENGPLGTRHPLVAMKTVIPDVMLVPLLAYDEGGNRIGWGGGFYDRTLAAYISDGRRVVAVGLAYDDQQVVAVPADELDVKMDWIVTEKRILKTTKESSKCGY